MKAVFLDTQCFGSDISFDSLKTLPLDWSFFTETKPAEILQRIKNSPIVVSNKVVLTKEILKNSPHLKLICVAATGYNNVDIPVAKELGIKVCNIPDYSTPSVVQLTITFMLALATNLISYVETTRKGKWEKSDQFCILDAPIIELQGKKLGIIGYGTLGKQVGMLAQAMGMKILIAQHSSSKKIIEGALPLDTVLKESDVITIHTPLTPLTQNLIQHRELKLMKPTAFLINTARGGIVNEKDLADSLKHRTIAGAGVDVLSVEPPLADNPLLQKDIPNLLLTPHVGWGSFESRMRLFEILKENIDSFLKGIPKNLL
jgi:glycerate dehydrogenase